MSDPIMRFFPNMHPYPPISGGAVEDELREELITFLIRDSHSNPKHVKFVDRELFATDNRRQIDQTLRFLRRNDV